MSSVSVVLLLALVAIVKTQDFQPVADVQCFQAISTGDCRARLPSFFYNLSTGTCDCFIFGGCQNNGNLFSTLEGCMNACAVQPRFRFQAPSSNCIGIFGADSPKFALTPRGTTLRPISFSSTTNRPPAVTARPVFLENVRTTSPPAVTARPVAAVKTTPRPTAAPVTRFPTIPPTAAPVTRFPTIPPTAAPVTRFPTIPPTSTTSAPRKPASSQSKPDSTPGPWDHWLNLD